MIAAPNPPTITSNESSQSDVASDANEIASTTSSTPAGMNHQRP
jgi:hypothetical protein